VGKAGLFHAFRTLHVECSVGCTMICMSDVSKDVLIKLPLQNCMFCVCSSLNSLCVVCDARSLNIAFTSSNTLALSSLHCCDVTMATRVAYCCSLAILRPLHMQLHVSFRRTNSIERRRMCFGTVRVQYLAPIHMQMNVIQGDCSSDFLL
jgi:hypothetical protein